MNDFKILYVKPKNRFRELTQKIFLKILLKLVPKKFLFYKSKVKTILNTTIYRLFFWLRIFLLRFKYPFYFNLPSQHLYSIHVMIKFLKILEKYKIDFFLICGALLGAVRQESFAGRPSDIDFGIKEDQLPKLMDAIPLLIKEGARSIRKDDKLTKLQILFRYTLVDVSIFRKKKEMGIGEADKDYDQKFNDMTFSADDLEHLIPIKLYGKKFLSPANPEIYLEKKYGKNWMIPDKK